MIVLCWFIINMNSTDSVCNSDYSQLVKITGGSDWYICLYGILFLHNMNTSTLRSEVIKEARERERERERGGARGSRENKESISEKESRQEKGRERQRGMQFWGSSRDRWKKKWTTGTIYAFNWIFFLWLFKKKLCLQTL